MKITASKKDDILKRKAQYEADKAAYDERQEGYSKAYRQAESAVLQPIKDYLERKLSRYSALTFDVRVDRSWMRGNKGGADVRIYCNEYNKFDENVALAWSYEATVTDDGEVLRKSSSWSGLSATTEAQMNSLRQTVSALEFLNDVDWEELINVDMPNYADYYDENDKAPEREDFDKELKEAELEELVGADKLVKVRNWGESCPYRGDVYLKILSETPAMYKAIVVGAWAVENALKSGDDEWVDNLKQTLNSSYSQYRIRKSSVRLTDPVEILDIGGIV